MEVSRRPQTACPQLPHPTQTSRRPPPANVSEDHQPAEEGGAGTEGANGAEKDTGEQASCSDDEATEPSVAVFVEAPAADPRTAERLFDADTSEGQDGCSEGSSTAQEKSPEEVSAAKKRSEEEEALAKERAAQRQLLSIEELVYTERNFLRMLQLSTVTIRNNLGKLQVWMDVEYVPYCSSAKNLIVLYNQCNVLTIKQQNTQKMLEATVSQEVKQPF